MQNSTAKCSAMSALALKILHCDNHLLVVDKPAGLPVQADDSGDPDLLSLAKEWIGRQFSKPGAVYCGLVHRLDRPARGVLVLARTSKAAARLSAQFAGHTCEKRYRAVVWGHVQPDTAELIDQLLPSAGSTAVVAVGGQLAVLRYVVVERSHHQTLLDITLQTGRKHQIRVQLAARGWPIVGDLRYGAPRALPDRSIALWAATLTVDHPTRPERLTFAAEPPAGWPWHLESRLEPR
ncbi:MAG: RNA pseudouridine synthase [Myxococcales bacterium]|nr:RNA pseudouridine synthase [Myxococcales bacterium]